MMKRILPFFVLLLFFSLGANARPHGRCSKAYASSTYWQLKRMPIQDKTMHCALSCELTLQCGPTLTLGLGVAKEIYDIFMPGNAEWEDLKADVKGMRIARRGLARNFGQCLKSCSALYEVR